MAKEALLINKFSGGLNSYSDPRDLEDNQFQILDNACVDEEGIIRVSGAFSAVDHIYGTTNIIEGYTPSYENLPIAGKGFYTFIIDKLANVSYINKYLESNSTANTSAWGVETTDNDSTWLFDQTVTYNTEKPVSKYSTRNKAAINYVEMAAVNDGDATAAAADGVYDMGNLKLQNISLEKNTDYKAYIYVVSDRPWYMVGGNLPPRLRIYNSVEGQYLWPDGFRSTSDATYSPLLLDDGSGNSYANNGNFIDAGTHDWAVAGSTNDTIARHELTTSELTGDWEHEYFNSFFGGNDVAGNSYYVLKFVTKSATEAATWYTTDGHYCQLTDITVVAGEQYLFDMFAYVPSAANYPFSGVGGFQMWDVDGGAAIGGGFFPDDSGTRFVHIGQESSISSATKYYKPFIFTIPDGCSNLAIRIGHPGNSIAIYIAGMNLRKRMLELGGGSTTGSYIENSNTVGAVFTDDKPISWSCRDNAYTDVITNTLLPEYSDTSTTEGNNASEPNTTYARKYEINFTTPNFESDNWIYEFQGGTWSNLGQTGYLNIIISEMNIVKTSMGDIDSATLNFFNLYEQGKTSLKLIESYNNNIQSNELTDEIGLPSVVGNSPSNYYMLKGSNKIYYCDETFQDNNLYSVHSGNNYELINSVIDFSGPSITSQSTAIAYTYSVNYFDALDNYLIDNEGHNNWGAELTALAIDSTAYFNDYRDNKNQLDSWIVGDNSPLPDNKYALKYDIDDGGWLESTSTYTKYMAFADSDIRIGIGHDTRLGRIDIQLSHFMLFGGGDSIYKTYVPNLKIYVDAVSDAVFTNNSGNSQYARPTHADDIGSGQEFIATIASVNVNPNNLIIGDGINTFGLSYRQLKVTDGWNGTDAEAAITMTGGEASLGDPVDHISWIAKDFVWKYKGTRGELGDDEAYNISIYFPYTFLYDAGQDGNINDSAIIEDPGINLQLRFQMDIKEQYDCWHMGMGDSVIDSNNEEPDVPKGILYESWLIKKINIHGFESGVDASTSAQYSHIEGNEIECVMNFNTPSNGAADGWDDDWDVVLTSVDNNGLESAFGEKTSFSNTDLTKCPNLGLVFNTENNLFTSKKSIKIYMRSSRNTSYNLQGIINLESHKIKSSTSPNEHGFYQDGAIIVYSIPREDLLIPNEIDSYESETGVLQENAENKSKMQAIFKTGIIANNVMYVGNVKQDGVEYPDRMLKSPIGKYPILPESNFIDVATDDGDEIVSLKFINDKILQFKKRKLFIINISDEYEYLEDTYDNLGIDNESQVTITQDGICWVNNRGCYLYTGTKVEYLSKNKISYKNWKDSESSWTVDDAYNPSITYLKKENKLLIYPSTESYNLINPDNIDTMPLSKYNKDKIETHYRRDTGQFEYTEFRDKSYLKRMGYQYDFDTKSWSVLCNFDNDYITSLDEGPHRTVYDTFRISNFQYDNYDNTCFLAMGFDDAYYCKWNDNPHVTPNGQERDFRVITKDYDFNSPAVNKKIYKTYVTFKSTIIESSKARKLIQNQDLYATSLVKVYYATNGSNTWTEFSTSTSTNYGTSGLLSTDCEATTTLASNIDNATDTQFVVASATNIKVGYVLYIGNDFDSTEYLVDNENTFEQMLVTAVSGTTITVERGYNNTSQFSSYYASGLQVNISTGDWITAELKPSASINNIKSIKLKFEVKTDTDSDTFGVPPGFMINDITVVYRTKNVK